jgi:hypothetical protein
MHPISDTESGLLPTVTAHQQNTKYKQGGMSLKAKLQVIPTITHKGNYNKKGLSKTSGDGIATILKSVIPTPCGRDAKSPKGFKERKNTKPLNEYLWNLKILPNVTTPREKDTDSTVVTHYDSKNQKDLTIISKETGLMLHPSFAEWMMALPLGWTELEWYPPVPKFKRKKEVTEIITESKHVETELYGQLLMKF